MQEQHWGQGFCGCYNLFVQTFPRNPFATVPRYINLNLATNLIFNLAPLHLPPVYFRPSPSAPLVGGFFFCQS